MRASAGLSQELRARLREQRTLLKGLVELGAAAAREPVWWDTSGDEAAQCAWLVGRPVEDESDDARIDTIQSGVEALALLNALAHVDYGSYLDEVRTVLPPTIPAPDRTKQYAPAGNPDWLTIGLAFPITETVKLAPVLERVFGAVLPTEEYLKHVRWLKSELPSIEVRPIPVRLHIDLEGEDDRTHVDEIQFSYVMRQVLHAVIAQRALARVPTQGIEEEAAAWSRFEIVEVVLDAPNEHAANSNTLEHIVRLVRLAVRVRQLPVLSADGYAALGFYDVAKSLQELLLSRPGASTRFGIQEVLATDAMTEMHVDALISAIHGSQTIKSVEMRLLQNPHVRRFSESISLQKKLWRWVAYALFSRHAAHNVSQVTLHLNYMYPSAIAEIERVLRAQNPLAALFNVTFIDHKWVKASSCRIYGCEGEFPSDYDSASIQVPEGMLMRVIETAVQDGKAWWCVLLPGYGAAWVDGDQAKVVTNDDVPHIDPVHLKLTGMDAKKRDVSLSLLRLIGDKLSGLEIEISDAVDSSIEMTAWTQQVLGLYPNLECLALPKYARVQNLQVLVDAAEHGRVRLKRLSLFEPLRSDSQGVVRFFDCLSDVIHPLSKHLEELSFAVSIPVGSRNDFGRAWRRLLQHNRSLHTISVHYTSQEGERLDLLTKPVPIRSGPLQIASKLALLSVIHDPRSSGTARGQLDTRVLAGIFQFAAQHRVRKIHVVGA